MTNPEMTKIATRTAIADAMAAAEAKKLTAGEQHAAAKIDADRLAAAVDGMTHSPNNRAPEPDETIDLPKGLRDLVAFITPMLKEIPNFDEPIQRMRTEWKDGQVIPIYKEGDTAQAIYDEALTAFEIAISRYDPEWDLFQRKRAAESILRTACYDVSRAVQQANRQESQSRMLRDRITLRGYEELRRQGLTTASQDEAFASTYGHNDEMAFERNALRQEEALSNHVYFSVHYLAIHAAFLHHIGDIENGAPRGSNRPDPKAALARLAMMKDQRIPTK